MFLVKIVLAKKGNRQKDHWLRKMNVRADGDRSAKRRRLNIISDDQAQAAGPTPPRTQSYLSLVGSHGLLPEPEGYHDGRARPVNGTFLLANAQRSASQDSLSRVEEEPSECCYGMVLRKSIASSYISARSLIELLRS